MYKFTKYNSKPFVFWDIKNKFIKKKSNKFISTKTFRKSFKSKVDFEKSTAKQKVDLEKSTTKQKVLKNKEIDDLMKKSKQFISFRDNSNFNDKKKIDELLDESLLLIICTELIYTSNRFNKQLYKKVFGKDWKNIQSLL